jgi:hypothetical protein
MTTMTQVTGYIALHASIRTVGRTSAAGRSMVKMAESMWKSFDAEAKAMVTSEFTAKNVINLGAK